MIKTCTLNGTKYDVMVGEIDGMCERAGEGKPNLVIAWSLLIRISSWRP
jgi:hypothetical protein